MAAPYNIFNCNNRQQRPYSHENAKRIFNASQHTQVLVLVICIYTYLYVHMHMLQKSHTGPKNRLIVIVALHILDWYGELMYVIIVLSGAKYKKKRQPMVSQSIAIAENNNKTYDTKRKRNPFSTYSVLEISFLFLFSDCFLFSKLLKCTTIAGF